MKVKILIDCDGPLFKQDVHFEVCRLLESIVFRIRNDGKDLDKSSLGALEDIEGRYCGYIDVEK